VTRSATTWIGHCLAALLLAGCVSPALAQRTGPEPWQYPDRDSLETAQRHHAGYWYENYEAAVDLAASTRPRDLEEAIDKLRLAVAERETSSLREMHPRNRYSFEYMPYYYLALAYSKLQREDEALACLQREERFGLAARSGVAREFSALQQRLQTIAAQRERRGTYGELLDQATAVQGWLGGEGGVSLTPDGRQRVERTGAAADRLRQLSSGTVDPEQETAAYDQLVEELLGLCRGELGSRRAQIDAHRAAAWREAFASQAALINAAACTMPGEGRDPRSIARARQAVELCNAQLLQATRRAGSWACEQLRSARRRVADGIAEQQRLSPGAAAAQPPSVPRACDTDWAAADLAAASAALERIEFGRVHSDLLARAEAVESALDQTRGELRRTADAAIGGIPELPNACVTELGLAQVKRTLDSLREEARRALAPGGSPAQLAGLEGRVGEALGTLSRAVGQGVERVLAERDGCEGVETGNLDALAAAYRTYQGGGPGAPMGELCRVVSLANRDIRTCWVNNTDAILAKITDYRWLLQAAESNDALHDEGGAGNECLAAGLASLRASRPSRNLDAWVRESQEGMTAAEACLGARDQERRERVGEFAQRLTRIERTLGEAAGAEQAESNATARAIAERARRAHTEVTALRGALEAVLALVDERSSPGDADRMRQVLQENGLAAGVPADWWAALERMDGTPDRAAHAWFLLGDRAAAGALSGAAGALDSWERLASVIGPYRALDRSYAAFEQGDLDGAILALRRVQSEGGLPGRGRGAAMAHAALAYFLFLKSQAEPESGDTDSLASLLRQNALHEAELAALAEREFRPPPALFESPAFRRFYDACCVAGPDDPAPAALPASGD
jgi:hypothetical protein